MLGIEVPQVLKVVKLDTPSLNDPLIKPVKEPIFIHSPLAERRREEKETEKVVFSLLQLGAPFKYFNPGFFGSTIPSLRPRCKSTLL